MPHPAKPKTTSSTRSRLKTNLLLPLLAASLLSLGACASSIPTGLLSPDSLYPAAITTCADAPAVPARPAPGQPRTDKGKAEYDTSLHAAWGDCHDTVAATAKRKSDYQAQYDSATKKPAGGIHLPNLFAKPAPAAAAAPSPAPVAPATAAPASGFHLPTINLPHLGLFSPKPAPAAQ